MGAVGKDYKRRIDNDDEPHDKYPSDKINSEEYSGSPIRKVFMRTLGVVLFAYKYGFIGAFGVAMLFYAYSPTVDNLRLGAVVGSSLGLASALISQGFGISKHHN